MHTLSRAAVAACAAALVVTGTGTTALASDHKDVDQTLLVPTTLDSSFAPFDCTLKATGPVCTGERTLDTGWGPTDWPCDVPVYGRFLSYRTQTRFYDHDYLNYDRTFRQDDVDQLSTSPEGPVEATITSRSRFTEPFAVPGDDSTMTIITTGTILDVQPVRGPSLLRVVGTLVEPPDGEPTFTGHVTTGGVTTRYEDAALFSFFSDELFIEAVCQAVTA